MTQSLINDAATEAQPQAWLRSAPWDILFIAAPAFISSALVLIFKDNFEACRSLPLWAWVVFVLLIDVAHVYATLFRTYFDADAFRKNSTLLIFAPLACWVVGAMLYSLNALYFWRVLAYLAVFHFIRQQYGFVALYSRKEPAPQQKYRRLDEALVYLSTGYPLLYWHSNLPRNFSWFVEGDFISNCPAIVADVCFVAYVAVAILYSLKEIICFRNYGTFNIPKNLIILGTALSWWVAIVAVNSDMSFTMVNVVSHGIPYMALIWLYHRNRSGERAVGDFLESVRHGKDESEPLFSAENLSLFARMVMSFAPAFIVFLCLFAYMEEGLWAGLVWREHFEVFRPFFALPTIRDGSLLALLVPLLSLPQSTHYVLDGFIWRVKERSNVWSA